MHTLARTLLALALLPAALAAQWDPANAQWGKTDGADLRIMTWNVSDTVCSTNTKTEGFNDWTALAVVIASIKPDVLVMQECGDNSGHGSGSGVDSVTNLTTTINLLFDGGSDPFKGGSAVTAYVKKYAPGYDLDFVFVSTDNDGFNRNVILSRWPFADLNGDTKSTLSDILIQADKWATTGDGGIRGFGSAEIDLPGDTYAGDMVIGNSHLKAGSGSSDHDERIAAAERISYYVDHLWNGAGTGIPDPNNKIIDSPAATTILAPQTPVFLAGDWNEDEDANGTKGPAEWLVVAQAVGGTDGTDRDRTDMSRDNATDPFNGSNDTIGTAKFDYVAWQDSIVTLRRAVVFNSQTMPTAARPPELLLFPGSTLLVSSLASDHRPVFADFILPLSECNDAVDLGQGKAGTGGLVPHFTVCGSLGTGGTADFLLEDARPLTGCALVVGLSQISAPYAGGVLVPAPDVLLFGFATNAGGTLLFPAVAGGGGPFSVYMQWVVFDPGASFGKAFSNGLRVDWLP